MYKGWATSGPCTATITDLLCFRRLGATQSRSGRHGEEKNLVPYRKSNSKLSAFQTEVSRCALVSKYMQLNTVFISYYCLIYVYYYPYLFVV
jgi:hypothetical protein